MSGDTTEAMLVQALHQHAVRVAVPPLDPTRLANRLRLADRIAALVKAAIIGGVVVALIAGLLILGNARRGDDVRTAESIAVASANGTTSTAKNRTKIVIGPNGEKIVIEDDGDPATVDSSTIVEDGSTTTTAAAGGVTTTSRPTDPNNPFPTTPGDPNGPSPTTGPTSPAPGDTTTTIGALPGPTVSSSSTTAPVATTTTTTPPPSCTGTMSPTSSLYSSTSVTISGRAVYGNGMPVSGGTVHFTWTYPTRGSASTTTDSNGYFRGTMTLSTPNPGDTVTVHAACRDAAGSVVGSFDTTFWRPRLVRI